MARRFLAALIGGGVALGAVAALAQDRDTPESLLPPGFGQPAPPPERAPATPRPSASATSRPAAPRTGGTVPPTATIQPLPPTMPAPLPSPSPSSPPSPSGPVGLAAYELPEFARRPLTRVGVPGPGVIAPGAFGAADGRWLEILMRRLSAPLPSRWLSIALRRLLVAEIDTPARVNGADFAAERAWLLLRMGEATAARAVVQGVDDENVTPKLRQVWMQAALANADPAGLCSLADRADVRAAERGWVVAYAMCQGLTGAGNTNALVSDLRRRRIAAGIDLRLAQKVVGAGAASRQAVTIEWDQVPALTAWRWGLATATGVAVPDELYATAGPQLWGWRALSPAIAAGDRAPAAEVATGMGVLSAAALVDLYSALGDDAEAPAPRREVAEQLREAYVGADRAGRLAAMRSLWDGGSDAAGRYGRLAMTARAAGRLAVFDGLEEADRFVASMLSAGLDRTALRWRGRVAEGGDAWAMLTLADPDASGALPYGSVSGYEATRGDPVRKRQLFFAGLAGLGRLSPGDVEQGAESLDVRIGAQTAWTRAIDAAARDNQPGTVLLLAAVGMQTGDWAGVPPAALYRIVGALAAVGLTGEARMVAAEAIARS